MLFYKYVTSDFINKKQVLCFDGEKKLEMPLWCEVAKHQACIENTFKWLEIGRVDSFGEKKI